MPPEPSIQSESPRSSLFLWESATIEVFVRAANLIGLPRSVGEIYGVLYCSDQALAFDDLQQRLGISRGSVSQGLKLLRQVGAVKPHYVTGSRRDYFLPELSMKRLVSGFIKDQFKPHLDSGASRLSHIEQLIEQEPDQALRRHAESRLGTLRTWQRRTEKLVPVIMTVLGGSGLLDLKEPESEVI
ncbi:MAG: GbsR/MarR family transcriptional regulator [Coraliomargarita sp.]